MSIAAGLSAETRLPDELTRIISRRAVTAAYQPIVDLETGETVAFEALARGPEGSPLENPAALFHTARATGRLGELDALCRQRAVQGMLEARLPRELLLFVNVEPASIGLRTEARPIQPVDEDEQDDAESEGAGRMRIVMEITERALTSRPAELLALVERCRSRGWGVALDDVGSDSRALALMSLIEPDVFKLDLRLVQARATAEIAAVVAGVEAQAERSGTLILAEGIETAEHLALARGMGARLGQGWYFGRPGPLPARMLKVARTIDLAGRSLAARRSPFEIAAEKRPVRRATKPLLLSMSHHLENEALALGQKAVVFGTFQHARHFTPRTRYRYSLLAQDTAFVGVLAENMTPAPVRGVRGARLADDDPLRGEWDLAVVGPHFAAALVSRDLGDEGPEDKRRFDYVMTYDRDIVVEIARSLMSRLERDDTV
jgi:EAL domain-containing protein (putative c-di-GMP-specific phosphodiesterase class I)